jgi:hypothetical protein
MNDKTTNDQLAARVADLERRVVELEARPDADAVERGIAWDLYNAAMRRAQKYEPTAGVDGHGLTFGQVKEFAVEFRLPQGEARAMEPSWPADPPAKPRSNGDPAP